MARTRQPNRNAMQKPQPDSWLAWCSPVPDGDDPMDRLSMSLADYLNLCENFYPSRVLESARHTITRATKEIKIPKLEDLTFDYVNDDLEDEDGTRYSDIPILRSAFTHRLSISDATDKVFAKLKMIRDAGPYKVVGERLRKEAGEFIRFLLDVQKFEREKIAQAKAGGRGNTAAKLGEAYKVFCMIELTGDINNDAEQLFLVRKITAAEFRVAMRRAFKLDREATDEINNDEQAAPPPQQIAHEKLLKTIAADAKRGADAAESTQEGVSFLVNDRKRKQVGNRERGKKSRGKAVLNDTELQRAKRDVQTALQRVADDPHVKAGEHGAVIAACRRVCSRFATLTGAKKNEPTHLPLTKADGTPLKAETLAKYYRDKYGTKRASRGKHGKK